MFAQIPTGKLIGKQHYRKKPSAAVQGKNHDGHAFVRDALRQGVGVIVEEAHIASLPDQSLLSLAQCSQKGIVVVPDTLKALAELALNALAQYQGEVIAVTGSVGKTTCKSMIAHTLAAFHQNVSEAPASFNNHIGVPLTALGMPLNSGIAVFELASSGPGEIETLSRIVNPHIRVISDVQPAHLQGFATQDVAAILGEKLQLFNTARPTDALVFNAANSGVWHSIANPSGIVAATRPTLEQSLWAFGVAETLCSDTLQDLSVSLPGLAVVIAKGVKCSLQLHSGSVDWIPQTSFELYLHECGPSSTSDTGSEIPTGWSRPPSIESSDVDTDSESSSLCIKVCVSALGKQLGGNAALAVATACAWMQRHHLKKGDAQASGAGVALSTRRIAQAVMLQLDTHVWLQSWQLPPGRMTMHQLSERTIVVDDAYNSNPASMMSALHTIHDLEVVCSDQVAVRRLCVLGCMAELGTKEQDYHQQVFQAVVDLDETSAILWGRAWRNVVVDLQLAAEHLERITWCGSADDAGAVTDCVLEWLSSLKADPCARTLNVVMLKGSRVQQVERVLEQLRQHQL